MKFLSFFWSKWPNFKILTQFWFWLNNGYGLKTVSLVNKNSLPKQCLTEDKRDIRISLIKADINVDKFKNAALKSKIKRKNEHKAFIVHKVPLKPLSATVNSHRQKQSFHSHHQKNDSPNGCEVKESIHSLPIWAALSRRSLLFFMWRLLKRRENKGIFYLMFTKPHIH